MMVGVVSGKVKEMVFFMYILISNAYVLVRVFIFLILVQ